MTHNNTGYAEVDNPHRVGAGSTEINVGLVEIDWRAQPAPAVSLVTLDLNGMVALKHLISL